MATDPVTGQPIPEEELKKRIAESATQPPRPSIPSPNAIPPAPPVHTMPAVTVPVSATPPPVGAPASPPKPPQTAWQKIGHGINRAANIAGDVLAPNITALIPGSDLNKNLMENRAANLAAKGARTGLENAQAETARESGQLVPFTDSQGNTQQVPISKWGPLEIERERAAEIQKATETKGQTARDVADTQTGSREKVAGETNQSREKIATTNQAAADSRAEAQRDNQFKIAQMRDNLENIISGRRESTQRDIATQEFGTAEHDLGPAPTGKQEGARGTMPDGTPVMVKNGRLVQPGQAGAKTTGGPGGKLGAQNQNRAEFAKTVIDQIPNITSEVDALAAKIGPGAGRWNDFWVKKVGANDPDYAALDQDLGLFASAVAVTHFGARGGGQHFIEALKKDFGQAQSPEDLKARIKSADKWLTGYANMGQAPK
jgi:hypothetical protein